jgi:alkanesulfonate monooxygenase SsuD/methylene tetrahydromethanopterin reductase-like flavin-dependent oxidoreductase (luciferase family)
MKDLRAPALSAAAAVRNDVRMTTLGAVCSPQVPPEQLRNVAAAAEAAGLDELWLWEDCFWGGAVPACAALLAWTTRLRVGIGVLPVPLRSVATTAMDTAMLHRLFPDRVTIGVGHGIPSWMQQNGAAAQSPMTLLSEYLTSLRALLAGDRVTADGRYVHLEDVALEWPPAAAPPILVGAIGPRSLRLSGEAADGTVLVAGLGPDEVRHARVLIGEGQAAAGRGDAHRLVVHLGVSGRDAADTAAAVRGLAEAGADTVVLQPSPEQADLDHFERFVRFAAEQVRPLL